MPVKAIARSVRGRPKKFGRPARPVTVTLPEDVLATLASRDEDLGRAIVSMVERPARRQPRAVRPAELASYGNHAVIIVTPVKALRRLAGVELVPIGNGRALVSLREPHAIPKLELDLRDALEAERDGRARATLEALAGLLRQARLSPRVTVEERTIIVLASSRPRPA
jgi:hypothetical protein